MCLTGVKGFFKILWPVDSKFMIIFANSSCGRQIPFRAVAALMRMIGLKWSNVLLFSADRLVFLKLWEEGVAVMMPGRLHCPKSPHSPRLGSHKTSVKLSMNANLAAKAVMTRSRGLRQPWDGQPHALWFQGLQILWYFSKWEVGSLTPSLYSEWVGKCFTQ